MKTSPLNLRDPAQEAHDRRINDLAARLTRGLQSLERVEPEPGSVDLYDLLRAAPVVTPTKTFNTVRRSRGMSHALKVSLPSLRVWVACAESWERAWSRGQHVRYEVLVPGAKPRWEYAPVCALDPAQLEAAWRKLLPAHGAQPRAA